MISRRNRIVNQILIGLLLLIVFLFLLSQCFTIKVGAAAPNDAPYIHDVTGGVITLYYPDVCGADVALLSVTNLTTGEAGPIYPTWRACIAGMGIYQTDWVQLAIMGPGDYLVTDCQVGYRACAGMPYPFRFQVWRMWLAVIQ